MKGTAIVRLKFTKKGKMRFLSHSELMRTMEKGARRARLPLLYTGGYRPRVKMSFSPPLPTGIESCSEFVDFFLEGYLSARQAEMDLDGSLPRGLDILEAKMLEPGAKPVGKVIDTADYRVELAGGNFRGLLARSVERYWQEESVLFERIQPRGARTVDIREGTYGLQVLEGSDEGDSASVSAIRIVCKDGVHGTVKPLEVLETLLGWQGISLPHRDSIDVTRKGLFARRGGRLISPMELGRHVAPGR